MIFRSIKWRLQLWHGLILLIVLGGFGYTAFELQRTREYRRVDQELNEHMAALLGPLRRPGRRPPNPGTLPPHARMREPGMPDGGEPPQGEGPRDGPMRGRPPGPLEIGRDSDAVFPEDGPFYFVVWDREGKIVRERAVPPGYQPHNVPRQVGIISNREYRELYQQTPRGEAIVVGRSIAPEMKEMRNLSLVLFGSGLCILVLGLAGGWVVATRAMRPIEKISHTAQKIATGDLSQRITHDETESELGRLVSVLNSTFARLEAAFKEQTRFTIDVSHELRTPVSVIVSQTQMALSRERPASDYRQSLEACQRAAQRMRRLIESLLELARLDGGQEQIQKLEFDLSQVAKDSAEMLQALAQEREVRLKVHAEPVRTVGDVDKMGQVITNLVTNAIRYSTPGGEVTIETRVDGELALLRVSDSGIGIPAEDLPHIFERFYRVDSSRSRDKGGSGLGLAITRALVHAHGGTIEVRSTPGKGSVFDVRIPRVSAS